MNPAKTDNTQKETADILSKIEINPRKNVERQLNRLAYYQLQILMKTFQCSIEKLADQVLRYKQGGGKLF